MKRDERKKESYYEKLTNKKNKEIEELKLEKDILLQKNKELIKFCKELIIDKYIKKMKKIHEYSKDEYTCECNSTREYNRLVKELKELS